MRQRLEKGQHFENGKKFTPFGRHVAVFVTDVPQQYSTSWMMCDIPGADFVGGQAHYG